VAHAYGLYLAVEPMLTGVQIWTDPTGVAGVARDL
jgi:hypothetical protein